jgi:endoglucanase
MTQIRSVWAVRRVSAVAVLLLASACGGGAATTNAAPNPGDTGNPSGTGGNGRTLLAWRGVSLAGAEFGETKLPGTYGPGADYIYPEAASVNYFAGKGMNLVRLAFRWERLQRSLNGELDATELARLKGFVDSVTAAGTTVLLDPHNYARYNGGVIGSAAVPVSAFANFWSRLALVFKANPRVMFGLMNEPHDMATEAWVTAANAAIVAIRATGAGNAVSVPGNAWTGGWTWGQTWYGTANAVAMLGVTDSGNNMLFEVHQYLDADGSGTNTNCVSASIGSERLAGFTQWLRANGRRGLLGEIGGGSNSTCNQAVAGALDHLTANNDVWAGWLWWAAGPWWGDYFMSLEPSAGGVDKPQMSVLAPYLKR